MSNVIVSSSRSQIQNLIPLASFFDGIWWFTAYDPDPRVAGWIWQFEFPNLDSAQRFMLRLPDDCRGAVSNLEQEREQRDREST